MQGGLKAMLSAQRRPEGRSTFNVDLLDGISGIIRPLSSHRSSDEENSEQLRENRLHLGGKGLDLCKQTCSTLYRSASESATEIDAE
jgi:hypothetical protein